MVVVVTIGSQAKPVNFLSSKPLGAFHTSHIAPGAKLSVAGASLIFEGGVNNMWYALWTREVLVMAIYYTA